MRPLATAALTACLGLALPAAAQKVLVLPDDDAAGSALVVNALKAAGMTVTTAGVPSYQYNGANPSPVGQDVVMILAGTPSASTTDMPAAGQTAIVNFVNVNNGGGLILTEWAAYQVANSRWQTLKPLVIVGRTSGASGFIDYTVTPAFANHPLWANVAASFQFATATNVGVVIPNPGTVRVATSKVAGDAVALRDAVGVGRIVYLSTAGDSQQGTWTNANLQQIVVNAAKWASASRPKQAPVANIGGPYSVNEGGTTTLNGSCMDLNGGQVTITWDLTNSGNFNVQGPSPTFDASALTGPSMQTINMKCTNTDQLSVTLSTQVSIKDVAPQFTSNPPTTATEGQLYSYDAKWFDPGAADTFTVALVAGPMGMTVDNLGHVRWLPDYNQARSGQVTVTITVTDQNGSKDTQTWTINVMFIETCMNGIPDTWQFMYFGKGNCCNPAADPDMDGRPNLLEYQEATNPLMYDGPTAPKIVSPTGGVQVMTATPTLVVTDAMEGTNDPVTYDFFVYSDAQLANVVDAGLMVPQAMNQTSYTVKTPLANKQTYYWRCRARDPYVASPWSMTGSFVVHTMHTAPTAPSIISPVDQAKVKTNHPQLVVGNATADIGLTLTYEFELYSDPNLTMKVESKAGVMEGGMGQTTYQVTSDLASYGHYWWRARATDSMGLAGPWSLVPTFEVFPNNPPPSPPVFSMPTDGARLPSLSPTLVFGGSVDVDGESITYQCDVDRVNTFDSPEKQSVSGLVPDGNDKAQWTPSTPLLENKRYFARCRAKDPSGESAYTTIGFLIDVKNDAPSVPTLTNPSDGGMAAGAVIVFTWVDSIDPEGDPIHYEIEIYSDAGLTQLVNKGAGGDGAVGLTLDGFAPGMYWWRARAVDTLGAASDWSKPNAFTDNGYTAPMYSGGGCGCAIGNKVQVPVGGALIGLALAAFALRRRRG